VVIYAYAPRLASMPDRPTDRRTFADPHMRLGVLVLIDYVQVRTS